MAKRVCKNGHVFEPTSSCLVCPICSVKEIDNIYSKEFPKLPAPAFRALNSLGIKSLKDLANYSEEQLLELHGFGPKALRMLKDIGIRFKQGK